MQDVEESFQEACAQFRTAPDLFRDEDRLHLYALYKQATAGKAPGYNAKTPRRALLRGAELAAWRSLQDMPSPEAKRAYAKIVADNRKNRETKEPQTPRTRSKTAAAAWRADRDLLDASLDGMDPKTLLAHARKLRDRVQTLSVGHVMRGGELIRHRETLTGHDWASRYFEVVPGFLRCYKSRTARELRLEVPLSPSVKVVADDVFDRKERKRAPTPFLLKLFLDKATMGASSRVTEITLAAPSKRDRDDWLQCVSASIELNASPLAMPAPPVVKKKKRSSTELLARTVHRRARPSLLSSDSSEAQSYGGFVNLIAVVAVVSNSRALLQEWHRIPLVRSIRAHFAEEAPVLTKRGRPVPPLPVADSVVPYELGLSFIALCLCVVLAVLVERRAARAPGRAASFHLLRALVVFSTLAVPLALCSAAPPRPVSHAITLLGACTAMMKLLSYAHTNAELRRKYITTGAQTKLRRIQSSNDDLDAVAGEGEIAQPNAYPANLRLGDAMRFMAFPTLIYQTRYPRTRRIRSAWLLKRCGELFLVVSAMLLITTQFVHPTVQRSYESINNKDAWSFVERLLALAIPSLFVWVLMFVALFELWLSILAELTRFGDRQFYKDWWNAQKFDEYWRLWNLPVHNWLVRHVFFPCLNLGLNKMAATLVVFFVSAALHEVLVSGPCHVARLYAFAGMMGQVPLIALTNALHGRLPSNRLGNVLFWVVFCVVGQPMALMLYFHDTVQSSSAGAKGSFGGEL
ncbi:unnamed protein product [Pelagomonas calceolata]|uniref:diacylglycerol O-acyltransferase n=1 Tax=Pelagomonas calceolata TaxID=35677 RepID=A0A8J2X3E7_9STRA|nr:unnamed protein product [Pelagomonas calceolata]|mmetsp:Transcript_20306/g.60599  ORF Transcript_20306/g.60599 Transcript_20306/m.60599 type:complete len:748 (-) Transcript_20306:62-2305(-)